VRFFLFEWESLLVRAAAAAAAAQKEKPTRANCVHIKKYT
jgi:hypothetical protein